MSKNVKSGSDEEREARLKLALKSNLRRRKSQANARAERNDRTQGARPGSATEKGTQDG